MKTTGTSQDWQRRLYEAKAAQWLLYGRALGLSHCEAQDVLQETFIALLALPAAPDSPEFYSLRAFRNRALNYRRGLWRRLRRELESIQWFERPDAPDAREAQAMGRLQQLPAEQREVIVLKIWHRHTFDQIGRLLDISPNTAAGRYRYGIDKLRLLLKEHSHDRPQLDRGADGLVETPWPLPQN